MAAPRGLCPVAKCFPLAAAPPVASPLLPTARPPPHPHPPARRMLPGTASLSTSSGSAGLASHCRVSTCASAPWSDRPDTRRAYSRRRRSASVDLTRSISRLRELMLRCAASRVCCRRLTGAWKWVGGWLGRVCAWAPGSGLAGRAGERQQHPPPPCPHPTAPRCTRCQCCAPRRTPPRTRAPSPGTPSATPVVSGGAGAHGACGVGRGVGGRVKGGEQGVHALAGRNQARLAAGQAG